MTTRHTVEIAEILVVQKRAIRSVVTGRRLGIRDELLLGIVTLNLVGSVLVTPIAVLILAIEVIVLAWMNDHRDFASANRTFLFEGAVGQVGNIRFQQFLNELAGAAFWVQQAFRKLIVRTRLVILRYTGACIVVALMNEAGVHDVHRIGQTVVRCLNARVLIVLGWIVRWLRP